jgi:hypothetical protein
VASGFFDTPTQNWLAMSLSKLLPMFWVREMAVSECLKEGSDDCNSGWMDDVVQVEIVLESNFL